MIAKIQIPRGWRKLRRNEKIMKGDMYLSFTRRDWMHAVYHTIGTILVVPGNYIRRIKRKGAK